MRWVALLVGSYLLGSISFGLAVYWLLERGDIRRVGSGNPGATNVMRTAGRWPALVVLLLDVAKGIVPVRVARSLGAPSEIVAAAALAVVVGHVFPIYFGFRGGKGVATGFGALLSLVPLAGGASLVIFLLLVRLTRFVSAGSVAAALLLPLFAWLAGRLGWTVPPGRGALWLATAVVAVVVLRHTGILRRLAAGSVRRLGEART